MPFTDVVKTSYIHGESLPPYQLLQMPLNLAGRYKVHMDLINCPLVNSEHVMTDAGSSSMVFVIARPLTRAIGHIPSGSRFQLSHWAVLVCGDTWNVERIHALVSDLNKDPHKRNDQLGWLYQLFRVGESKSGSLSSGLQFIPKFTARDLIISFPKCLIAFAGTTDLGRDEIIKRGKYSPLNAVAYNKEPRSTKLILITVFVPTTVRRGLDILWKILLGKRIALLRYPKSNWEGRSNFFFSLFCRSREGLDNFDGFIGP